MKVRCFADAEQDYKQSITKLTARVAASEAETVDANSRLAELTSLNAEVGAENQRLLYEGR